MVPYNRYPVGLVPYVGLKDKIIIPDLSRPENHFDVARRIRKEKLTLIDLDDDYLIIPAEMRPRVFETREIPDLSMNIMSRDNRADFVNYGQYGIACSDWNKKTVIPHKYSKYVKREDTVALVFRAKDFHLIPIPYYKAVQSQSDFNALEPFIEKEDETTRELLANSFKRGNKYKVIGLLELEHKPTMMNYWHITLVIREDGTGKIVSKAKNAAEKELCNFVIDHILASKGVLQKEKCRNLHPFFYVDTKINPVLANIYRWFRNWLTSGIQLEAL